MNRSALLILAIPACVFGAEPKAIASYTISARLLTDQKAVSGRELLAWTNDSPDRISELQFHLYMNAFKNEKSTFMRESGGQIRGDRVRKDAWGWIDVKKLQISGGPDLTKAIEFLHPDDENADDQTVARVPLPRPVPPGGQIQIEIEFYTKFPHVFARSGFHGDFFFGGQWFPKIGVYEKAGIRYAKQGRWNCHQYHATSEFYADYGQYDVQLTTPANYVVGATGVEMGRWDAADGAITRRFLQDNVHDFAWTAQPRFIRLERLFDAEREVRPTELTGISDRFGITHEDARLSNVRMILLLQPEHTSQAERHFAAVRNGLKYFGLWYGRYPYQTITVVDPPHGGGGAEGMEYPTLITAGTRWLIGPNDGSPEEVTVHEFGHQFWYGLVATNEFEEAWMDEGFNVYSTGEVMDKAYGQRNAPQSVMSIPLSLLMRMPTYTSDILNRAGYLAAPTADDLARNAWQYESLLSYGVNSYPRTALMLRTLANTIGAPVMARVMRTYQQRWRYAHPAAPDFIKVVNEVSGKDMTWFFDQFVYGSTPVDYSVANVKSDLIEEPEGVFDRNGKRVTITPEERSRIDGEKSKQKKETFRTKITIRREGVAVYPIDLLVRFANGETERRQWDGRYRWIKYEFVKPSKAAMVQVDPDHKLLLDANWTNNSWVADQKYATPIKWSATLMFWVQQMMAALSVLS
jgi:hypothetical protein